MAESPDRAAKSAAANAPAPTISELKEQIMANAKSTDFTKPIADALSDAQGKAFHNSRFTNARLTNQYRVVLFTT